jgi:hypothetical protein
MLMATTSKVNFGWVFSDGKQGTSKIYQARAVECKQCDSGTPGWCETKYLEKVLAPGKVVFPTV